MAKTVRVILDDRKLQEIIRATAGGGRSRIIADGGEYGGFNELGTSRMSARPFLVPAFEEGTRDLGRALGQAIERGVSLDAVIGKTAFDVQAGAQRNIQDKHIIDTGALFNSMHVEEE